jgi:hypothetical protein
MINTKMGAFLLAAFVAGAFVASPELMAYAANTVFSTDIKDGEVKTADLANNAVTSAKIKDGEVKTDDIAPGAVGSLRIKDNDVKAQDIAPDAVGASELQGVSKLIFAECNRAVNTAVTTGIFVTCPVPGAAPGDNVLVTQKSPNSCFVANVAYGSGLKDNVTFIVRNICGGSQNLGSIVLSVLVYRS